MSHTRYMPIILSLIIYCPIYESVTCTKASTPCECVTDEPCELNCIGTDFCKGSGFTLKCQPNQPCNVLCSGANACQDATIDANGASDVTIQCAGTDNGVCTGSPASYHCGSGDCSIQCVAPGSCSGITVHTNSANSFTCSGTSCPSNLQSLQYTAAPTTTANPTETINCVTAGSPCECQSDNPCKLNCQEMDGCSAPDFILRCAANQPCDVVCQGNSTCQEVTLDANGATDVAVICKGGTYVCASSSAVFNCGSGDCSVRCRGDAPNSCTDAIIHTNSATSFECLGTGCPSHILELQFPIVTAAPTTTSANTTTHSTIDDAPDVKKGDDDDYITIIIIIGVCVLGLGAIAFGVFCIYRWKKNKATDESDDEMEVDTGTIDYTAQQDTTKEPPQRERYSMSNNALAQPPAVSVANYNNNNQYSQSQQIVQMQPMQQPVQVTQNGPMYNAYTTSNMNAYAAQQQPHSHANMMQQAPHQQQMQMQPQPHSHVNMMQQAPQQQPQHTHMNMQLQPTNPAQYATNQGSNMDTYAAQTSSGHGSGGSQRSVNSDGTDASLYEKQAEYAQEEMKEKNKSTRSVLSANTDVSLYDTQQRYLQQELTELNETKEVDTFEDGYEPQNLQVEQRRMSAATAATDVSLYETQQKYLQEEMDEINERRSVSKRKSSTV